MIKFATKNDIADIMDFIENHWKHGHILARDRNFFEYLYITDNDRVNFAISKDNENKINGLIGYIPYDKNHSVISLALWKALNAQESFIGMELFEFLMNELKTELIATVGVNIETSGEIYLFFDYELGKMNHYFRLNELAEYKIAKVIDKLIPEIKSGFVSAQELKSVDEIPKGFKYDKNAIPKSVDYIKRRYFNHPVFKYNVNLFDDDLIVITRLQEYNSNKCLRIVDILGDYNKIPVITGYFDNYMKKNNIEYIDCYNSGISNKQFTKAGFIEIQNSKNIIPEYFSPFEQKNIDIGYSSSKKGTVLFKGDGDMDRPN